MFARLYSSARRAPDQRYGCPDDRDRYLVMIVQFKKSGA
jgi:hypothetical protein